MGKTIWVLAFEDDLAEYFTSKKKALTYAKKVGLRYDSFIDTFYKKEEEDGITNTITATLRQGTLN